jgi:hypothetical protein
MTRCSSHKSWFWLLSSTWAFDIDLLKNFFEQSQYGTKINNDDACKEIWFFSLKQMVAVKLIM